MHQSGVRPVLRGNWRDYEPRRAGAQTLEAKPQNTQPFHNGAAKSFEKTTGYENRKTSIAAGPGQQTMQGTRAQTKARWSVLRCC